MLHAACCVSASFWQYALLAWQSWLRIQVEVILVAALLGAFAASHVVMAALLHPAAPIAVLAAAQLCQRTAWSTPELPPQHLQRAVQRQPAVALCLADTYDNEGVTNVTCCS